MTTAPYNKADLTGTHKVAYASKIKNEVRIQKVGTTAFNNDFHKFTYSEDINEQIAESLGAYLQQSGVKNVSVQQKSDFLKDNFELNVWTRGVKGIDSYLDELAKQGIDLLVLVLDRQGMTDPIGGTSINLSGFGLYQRAFFGTEQNYVYFLPVFHFIDTREKKVHFSRVTDLYTTSELMSKIEGSVELYSAKNQKEIEAAIEDFIETAIWDALRKEGL